MADECEYERYETKAETTTDMLIETIFMVSPPPTPFKFRIQFIDPNDYSKLASFLGHFLMYGCKKLYNVEPCKLTLPQISTLRDYILSIGYDIDYNPIPTITTNSEGVEESDYKIMFKPADRSLEVLPTPDTMPI